MRDGRIIGIGKAGNPDVMDGVDPNLVVGSSTEAIAGEKLIVTAGAIDAHCHFICPQQVTEALASGTTTMIGGGTGPSAGTSATTCTPSPFYMRQMFAATDSLPMNFAFTGKGNDSGETALEEIVLAGAAGLKLHEDWGTTPSVIVSALNVGDKYDVQVRSLMCTSVFDLLIARFPRSTFTRIPSMRAGSLKVSSILTSKSRRLCLICALRHHCCVWRTHDPHVSHRRSRSAHLPTNQSAFPAYVMDICIKVAATPLTSSRSASTLTSSRRLRTRRARMRPTPWTSTLT